MGARRCFCQIDSASRGACEMKPAEKGCVRRCGFQNFELGARRRAGGSGGGDQCGGEEGCCYGEILREERCGGWECGNDGLCDGRDIGEGCGGRKCRNERLRHSSKLDCGDYLGDEVGGGSEGRQSGNQRLSECRGLGCVKQ